MKKILWGVALCALLSLAFSGAALAALPETGTIGIGGTATGSIEAGAKDMNYRFSVSSPSYVAAHLSSSGERQGLYIKTLGGSTIARSVWTGPGMPGGVTASTYLYPGDYVVAVSQNLGCSPAATRGDFTLSLSAGPALPSDPEPNNTRETATDLAIGQTIDGLFAGNNDVDYYRITLSSDTRAKLSMASAGWVGNNPPVSCYGSLYDANQTQIFSYESLDSVGGKLLILKAGAYYLKLASNNNTNGCYTLKLWEYAYASGVSVAPAAIELAYGQSATLTATLAPEGVDDQLRWSVDNSLCSVSASFGTKNKATVTAKYPGTSIVTATTETGLTASVTVTVPRPPITKLKLSHGGLNLSVGFQYAALKTSAEPNVIPAPNDIVWSSDNPQVLGVAADGSLSALALGRAILTAYSPSCGLSARCVVDVGINELSRTQPPAYERDEDDDEDYGAIISCAKRMYYKGKYLYVEVFLSNQTLFKISKKGSLKLYVYDYALSETKPAYKKTLSWSPGTLKRGKHKVFKYRLPKGKLLGRDLGSGQMEAVIVGNFRVSKALPKGANGEPEARSRAPRLPRPPRALRRIR